MARVMLWNVVGLSPTGFTDLLSPPLGKKYEVIDLSVAEYGGTADTVRSAINVGGFYLYLDEFKIAAGEVCQQRSYASQLIVHPFAYSIGLSVGPGSSSAIATVTFIDVDT